jgi:phosphatidylglycerol---prolipoprotein diacylglyceryl transferase
VAPAWVDYRPVRPSRCCVFEYPDIDPVAFSLGPLAVRWYGLMFLGAFLAAWALARLRASRGQGPLAPGQVDDLIFYGALGVIVGGRVGSVLFYNFATFLSDPLMLFRLWEGGMSFHGGLLGVIFAMWLYGRRLGVGFFALTDFVAPLVPVGLGLGRLGNFINGELWGKVTSAEFPLSVVYGGVPRHPSQLYQAALEGLVLFVILWLYSSRPRPVMSVSGLFLVCYGVFRFAVEFVRLPDAWLGYLAFGWLTMGQLLSLPMILLGAWLLWRSGRSAGHARVVR